MWVVLLTLTHPGLPEPVYLSTDPTERISSDPYLLGTRSRGRIYKCVPVDVVVPGDSANRPGEARLSVQLIDPAILKVLRRDPSPGQIALELVTAAAPDTIEVDFGSFTIAAAPWTQPEVTVVLQQPSLTQEPFPFGSMTPNAFGGLFR